MEYLDDDIYIKMESGDNGRYFYCLNCGKKVYEDEVEKTDKWWDDDGNHRMVYNCPYCNHDNYA